MKRLKQIAIGSLACLFAPLLFANKITICVDTNFWYPFTYIKDDEVAGLHIDIINTALRRVGFEPLYRISSWGECFKNAQLGIVDAIATASYRDERAVYLNYPQGAAVDTKSPWRVTQVGYVVVTSTFNKNGQRNNYKFNGNFRDIPEPVRTPAHYAVVRDLEKEGLAVKQGRNSFANFKQLLTDRAGSIIDVEEVAEHFIAQPEFAENLVIQNRPLDNKSYYLVFSKRSKIKVVDAERIWWEISRIREDSTLMTEFLKKY